jgi:hypothetical protein
VEAKEVPLLVDIYAVKILKRSFAKTSEPWLRPGLGD